MDLLSVLKQVSMEVDLEETTIAQYRRAVDKFGLHLGKIPTTDDLTLDNVNGFFAALKQQGKSTTTIRNYRSALTRIWNTCISRDLVAPYDIRRLRCPKITRGPVRSWSLSQVKMLADACEMVPGRLHCGVRTGDMLAAMVRLGYDTGLRPGDIRRLRWDAIDFDKKLITLCQHKTGRMHAAPISDALLLRLERIKEPSRTLVFPLSKSGVRRLELILFKTAESLGFRRVRGQGLGTLRKCHATQIFEIHGETAAAESLGHVGGTRTVRMHYIDARSIKAGRLPPEPKAG